MTEDDHATLLREALDGLVQIYERSFAPSHAALAMGSEAWVEGRQLREAIDAAKAALASAQPRSEVAGERRWRHIKRGTVYREVGRAELQTSTTCLEGSVVVIYAGVNGKLWARPDGEFMDGRFEELRAPAPSSNGSA